MRQLQVALVTALMVVGLPAAAGTLHDKVRSGHFGDLAQVSAEELEALDEKGDTPLIAAALTGRIGTVAALLDAGARIDGRSDRGMTPLHAAAYHGHADVVALLLDRGADPNDRANKFGVGPLHVAAEEGHLPVVETLTSRGAAVDLVEAHGYTALTRAGWKENWDVVAALRKAGADCPPVDVVGEEFRKRCLALGH